jgi:hypothetical protein
MMSFYFDDAVGALDELFVEHVWHAALENISETCIRSVPCPMFGDQTACEAYAHMKDELVSAGEQGY